MKRLAEAIAGHIREHVTAQVAGLSAGAEFRAVFNGPPQELLQAVFVELTRDGGLDVVRQNGEVVQVPVLQQVEALPEGKSNPPIGRSGVCNPHHLMDVRNSPNCPIFLALLPPGNQGNLSQSSTRSDFGLAPENNGGTATIGQWWGDDFVQSLVNRALDRHAWGEEEFGDAKALVEEAVIAADQVDLHDVDRRKSWAVLARLWSISDKSTPFGTLVSVATGFPPVAMGSVDARSQRYVMSALASRLEELGFRPGIEQIKNKADEEGKAALDEVLSQLHQKCSIPTALARSMPYYYGPFVGDTISTPPAWWSYLTAERWAVLLEEDEPRKQAIHLECVNSIASQLSGFIPVVEARPKLRITIPDEHAKASVKLTRDVGGAKNQRQWILEVDGEIEVDDEDLPDHKSPVRYSVEAVDPTLPLKKGTLRVVVLESWVPGVVACSRTATKASIPKTPKSSRDGLALEASMVLVGEGRHYLDLYVRSGVQIGPVAHANDESGAVSATKQYAVAKIDDQSYGLEVEATADCFYDLQIIEQVDGEEENSVLRLYLSAEEVSAEECSSEFERLILLNRQRDGGRATSDVNVDRRLRCFDLESWLLAPDSARSSFKPLVLGEDYASDWRPRDWSSPTDTIYSKGRYLSDPRPNFDSIVPPKPFLDHREVIAKRIRGEDGSGVVEAARLGEWLVADPHFCEVVEDYVRSYTEWLEAAPDIAPWCDVAIAARFESDGQTLVQEPDALLISPLHPLRLAWQALAQRALFLAHRKKPCPAASILDPDCVPDCLSIPLRSAAGATKAKLFFSVESSSDYWPVLWNASSLERLAKQSNQSPFDAEFGITVGGISSGFSVSQVHRSLDDVTSMLIAKPVLNILIASAAGQNNACNEGLIGWAREHFAVQSREDRPQLRAMGPRILQILDERKSGARPEDADISNLAEDTANTVRWYGSSDPSVRPDLGIIAQLETSSAQFDEVKLNSALSEGGLIRSRIRQQLKAAAGAFLSESRNSQIGKPSGDGLADRTANLMTRLENMSDTRMGYVFAPSVHAIQGVLQKAEFAAVSSAAVDPACFLGGWLDSAYLWDYQLPSYSGRAGDSNGYYLLSAIKDVDREAMDGVLARLPGCKGLPTELIDQVILEVARRGIPTVRGLSSGDAGASGDLALFIASRLLQDDFRPQGNGSLLPVWVESEMSTQLSLIIPVDPFQGYLDDLTRAIKKPSYHRPDFLVAAIVATDSELRIRLTPVEVKYRGAKEPMSPAACASALEQAKSMGSLLQDLAAFSDDPELILWKLSFRHLLASMLEFGFRVYSQQPSVLNRAPEWSALHARISGAIIAESQKFSLEIDPIGRLVVVDGTHQSGTRDIDGDGFTETIVLSHADGGAVVRGDAEHVYGAVRTRVNGWRLFPEGFQSIDFNRGAKPTKEVTPAAPSKPTEQLPVAPPATGGIEKPNGKAEASVTNGVLAKTAHQQQEPAVEAGVRLLIGESIDGFNQDIQSLNLSDTNLNQLNTGVVGDLGTGKTQLLQSLVYQLATAKDRNRGVAPRMLIFDYKRDYSSDNFVRATNARVVKPQHLPINLFDISGANESMTPWLDRFKFFSDILDKIYSGVGPVQRSMLKRAVRQAYDKAELDHRQPTIYDVHFNYQNLLGNKADAVSSIIDDLVDMELFSPAPTSTKTFDEFLDGVVVIALDALGQDDRTKSMLVAIMLNMFYEHMLRIPKRPYVPAGDTSLRVVDSFLLVDEADNIMRYEFDVLRKILLQGREFGVGVILASQYLRHFKAGATDYREPLLTWFIHKVPSVQPQEIGALGIPGDVLSFTERIKTLARHECLFKTQGVMGQFVKGVPFYRVSLKEHALVKTNREIAVDGVPVPRGTVGTIVAVYRRGEAFAVEFNDLNGKTEVLTIPVQAMEPADG
jgi:DNA phosphorothioation-dependent restriction protein DptH